MLHAVRCPECSSLCLTLRPVAPTERALLLVTGRMHYQSDGCGNGFRARDRRTFVPQIALLFLTSFTLATASKPTLSARISESYGST